MTPIMVGHVLDFNEATFSFSQQPKTGSRCFQRLPGRPHPFSSHRESLRDDECSGISCPPPRLTSCIGCRERLLDPGSPCVRVL